VKFHKGKDICLFSRNLEGFLLWYFETPKFSISFLSFWGSSNFLCEVFTSKETEYVPFFMRILKPFVFIFLKFQNLVILEVSHGGNNVGGIILKFRVFKFVLMEFKDLQLCY